MNDNSGVVKQIQFDSEPDTQEFLNGFLRALEEQYSYDRLKNLSPKQLDDEANMQTTT